MGQASRAYWAMARQLLRSQRFPEPSSNGRNWRLDLTAPDLRIGCEPDDHSTASIPVFFTYGVRFTYDIE